MCVHRTECWPTALFELGPRGRRGRGCRFVCLCMPSALRRRALRRRGAAYNRGFFQGCFVPAGGSFSIVLPAPACRTTASLPMPIYAYKCSACGHAKDVLQKMSDTPLSVCPACGAESFSKQVTAAGFQLKGSGWYVTDFRDGGSNKGGATATDKPAVSAAPAADAGTPAATAPAPAVPAPAPAPAPVAAPSTPS